MKRLCVAGIILAYKEDSTYIILGRRGKEPYKGMYVLPGGGVEEGETLEQALRREVKEETGLDIIPSGPRWNEVSLIELDDRIIIITLAAAKRVPPKSGSDLYDVDWFNAEELPDDISPNVCPVLERNGFHSKDWHKIMKST